MHVIIKATKDVTLYTKKQIKLKKGKNSFFNLGKQDVENYKEESEKRNLKLEFSIIEPRKSESLTGVETEETNVNKGDGKEKESSSKG